MQKTETIDLGNFQMQSDVARVTDPCYEKDTWCAGTVGPILKGDWMANVIKKDSGSWGVRCSAIVAHHLDHSYREPSDPDWERQDIDVGVDSGQAGIFDEDYFKDDTSVEGCERGREGGICIDEPFYSICCDRTLSDIGAGVIPYGCVSSSGFGDGSYNCSVIKEDDKVVAIMIDFGLEE